MALFQSQKNRTDIFAQALKSNHQQVRLGGARGLRRTLSENLFNPHIISLLKTCTTDSNPLVRKEAFLAWKTVARTRPGEVTPLLPQLMHALENRKEPLKNRLILIKIFKQLKTAAKGAIPVLLKLAADPSLELKLRLQAVETAPLLCPPNNLTKRSAIAQTYQQLFKQTEKHPKLLQVLLKSLDQADSLAGLCLAEVVPLLEHPQKNVIQRTQKILLKGGNHSIALIIQQLRSAKTSRKVKRELIILLKAFGNLAQPAFGVLSEIAASNHQGLGTQAKLTLLYFRQAIPEE